jgi:hypothetical protein
MKQRLKLFGITVFSLLTAVAIFTWGEYIGENGKSISIVTEAEAQQRGKMPKDNIIDGELYPHGYTPPPMPKQ